MPDQLLSIPRDPFRSRFDRLAHSRALTDNLISARREAIWRNAALALHVSGPLDRGEWQILWHRTRGIVPLIVAIAHEALADAVHTASQAPFAVEIRQPDPGIRSQIWRALLPPKHAIDDDALDHLSRRYPITPARAATVIRHAVAESAVNGTQSVTAERLAASCRVTAEHRIGLLAKKLVLPYRRDDLVVSPRIAIELELAITWLRERRRILDDWQLGSRLSTGRGFVGLFAGPPGTGKTMAAQVIARELDFDLYRVDLSATVSKYVGETEKNLARLFDEARAAGVGLLFDEADALFGKRSETRDAQDRYANIEIGYLLQRIEDHDGFVILTTNRARDLDEAFVRRFHAILDFQPPDATERARIWQFMLPAPLPREALDIERLARFQSTGGEIRNVVVAAACLATAEQRPLSMKHLDTALRREFSKNGRVIDERLFSTAGGGPRA
jgi:hypothetical protein